MEQKPYHHGNLRVTLIETGIQMINEQGIGDFSLRKLAAKCGVSRSAPYSHFKDKEDMLESMKNYVADKFIERLKETIENNSGNNKIFVETGKSYVHFFMENPNYYPFLFNQGDAKFVLSTNDSEELEKYNDLITTYPSLTYVIDELDLTGPYQIQNILAFWSVVHGLAGISTMNGAKIDGDFDVLIERILTDNIKLMS